MIEIRNLSKSYADKCIINNLNIKFDDNKIYGICGKSGIGKTTLLRAISNLESFDGTIEKEDSLTYMFQEDRLLPWYTARENLRIIIKNNEVVEEIIGEFNLSDEIDKQVNNLSGGNKRKVALARTFGFNSKNVILDEPFNGIDRYTRDKIKRIILEYKERVKCTLLIISHDIDDLISLCDEIVTFDIEMKIKNRYIINKEENIIEKALLSQIKEDISN